MAHTFDIRIANPVAVGTLRIDAAGISLAVRRGVLRLFTRTRRIAVANLRQVYREGDALHFTFITHRGAREKVLTCRAASVDAAAEILGLFPARRTIEFDHPAAGSPAGSARPGRTRLWLLMIALCVAGAWWWVADRAPLAPAIPRVEAPHIPLDVNLAPPHLTLPRDYVVTIPRESPDYAVASRHLAAFEHDAGALLADYRVDRALLESGALDVETFGRRLENLEFRWWGVTYRMLEDGEFADLVLLDLRATLLAAARHWRAFLAAHAEALRQGDHVAIAKSFDELARAEELMSRARLFLR